MTLSNWNPAPKVRDGAIALLAACNAEKSEADYEAAFYEAANSKLNCNKRSYREVIDAAFEEGVILDYHQKLRISRLLDSADYQGYSDMLESVGAGSSEKLLAAFQAAQHSETLERLNACLSEDGRADEVLNAIFSRYIFQLAGETNARRYYTEGKYGDYDYLGMVADMYPDLARDVPGLIIVNVDKDSLSSAYGECRNETLAIIKKAYDDLRNHSDMAIVIPPAFEDGEDLQWRLCSETVLFAEKFLLTECSNMYFRKKKIAEITKDYIPGIDAAAAEFDKIAEGFVFKDCFVVSVRDVGEEYLAVVLELNKKDERVMPCPACYSSNVQGNSYPILNVRSWECENPICPDKSKYNRGKRYQLSSIIRQSHINEADSLIPIDSISKWHRDRASVESVSDVFEMLIRHYSFAQDMVHVYSANSISAQFSDLGRKVVECGLPDMNTEGDIYGAFAQGPFFARYNYDSANCKEKPHTSVHIIEDCTIVHGDSGEYLSTLDGESVDAAVTSPPYYNAKSYSTWPNIYCYLYDMRRIAKEVYRVLKPGGVFLYNIFDCFDNENSVTFSAMGDKRMILGPYTVDLFRRLGFSLYGNLIWDKGEIQGNRSFNQGNLSPYYQAPLNCWEHVFVFSKGTIDEKFESLRTRVLSFPPVIKMVRGVNVSGHEAPFPEDVPNIVLRLLQRRDIVLDPFAGSFTTSVAAQKLSIASIGIEQSGEYCDLGMGRIKDTLQNGLTEP